MAPDVTRRAALAGTAASLASAGCLGRVRNIAGRDEASPVTLDIRTVPTDSDPHAIRIARHLAGNLKRAGIEPRLNTTSETELYRQVLVNQDFDLYVGQFPEPDPFDPDLLYPFCHSSFTTEPGWQNPFGLTDLTIDKLLDRQRRVTGSDRISVVNDLQVEIARQQPFVTVAFPDDLMAVRDTNFEGWRATQPAAETGIVALEQTAPAESTTGNDGEEQPVVLRLLSTDAGFTKNRNPIAVEYRRNGTYTGLLYDPLVRGYEGETFPCLARDVTWSDGAVRLSLRDVSWHDGEPFTAEDVAFTYAFLADTSMGEAESPIPTSRFRGQVSLVESATAVADDEVEIQFGDVSRAVAERALRIPILPKHVWSERTDPASIAGVEVNQQTTEALIWSNPESIGTGPLRFVEAEPESHVVLERNDDHPIATGAPGIPESLAGKPSFDRLDIEVVPSDIAAIQQLGDGYADATASSLGPNAVPRVGRESDVRLVSEQSAAFYHIGFNARNDPLSNPHFRQAVARLVDKGWLASETFDGYARPAASPLAASEKWVADELEWNGTDPVTPFLGENGTADKAAARKAFRDIGYRYSDDEKLLGDSP
ncbi:MAG: ABC transporter substrate-binding protein [Halopenitus sp.]